MNNKKIYIIGTVMIIIVFSFMIFNVNSNESTIDNTTFSYNTSSIEYIVDFYNEAFIVTDKKEIATLPETSKKMAVFYNNEKKHIIKSIMDKSEGIFLEHIINNETIIDEKFNFGPSFVAGYGSRVIFDSNAPKKDEKGVYTDLTVYNIDNFTYELVGKIDLAMDFVQKNDAVYITSFSKTASRNNIFKYNFKDNSLKKVLISDEENIPNTVIFNKNIMYGIYNKRPLGKDYNLYKNSLCKIENGELEIIKKFDFEINNAILHNEQVILATINGVYKYDLISGEISEVMTNIESKYTKIYKNNEKIVLGVGDSSGEKTTIYELNSELEVLDSFVFENNIEFLRVIFSIGE